MKKYATLDILLLLVLAISACTSGGGAEPPQHDARWGIYALDLSSQSTVLIYSSENEITNLSVHPAGETLAFGGMVGGSEYTYSELFTIGTDGSDLQQLTSNDHMDTYPVWSPDGSQMAYLSFPGATLDIYRMNADGSNAEMLYDSGYHDSDINWVNGQIAFTRNSQIWMMNADGSDTHQLTNPLRAGEWGNANLPFGDYDPRISPDGAKILFERLLDDSSPHGNYDLYTIDIDGSNLTNLTNSRYSQGLASWSPSGEKITYIVSAIEDVGQFDLYVMNADGTDNENVTPVAFPPEFLIHWVTFSNDDALVYIIGEWWSDN